MGGVGVGASLGLEHVTHKDGYSDSIKFSASGEFAFGLSASARINHGQMLRDTNTAILYTLNSYQNPETFVNDISNAVSKRLGKTHPMLKPTQILRGLKNNQ